MSGSTGMTRLRPVAPPPVARALAFAALVTFGLLHWMGMVAPWQAGRAFAALAVAVAAFAAPRRALPLVVLGALVAGGVAPADLWPWHWGALAGAVTDGIGSVVGARIPYVGDDPDVRLVLFLGGAALATVAGLLARRYRLAALAALVVLYAVPAIAINAAGGFLSGAGMAVLVVLFLSIERLPQRDLGRGAVAVGVAALVALAVAPALDTTRPWFDYEEFAVETAGARSTSFSWDHDYGRLPWPRDGREMLRVRSPRRSYWKVDALDLFDGERWRRNPTRGAPPPPASQVYGVPGDRLRRWSFPISVSVRNLRSPLLALAGSVAQVTMPGREPGQIAASVWSAGRPVRRGDAYQAQVYVPQPSQAQLEAAGTRYPVSVIEELAFTAIDESEPVTRPRVELLARTFGGQPRSVSYGTLSASGDLRRSNLRRIHALSRQLLQGAATPYDYVRAVQRHLEDGFRYDEVPPRAARTLDGFLFEAKAGFCQQFSGAMALLLRMGGVPARVATGFAPGSYDQRVKRFVVRDVDAHSWVEAWFEGIGWVVFDPTPAAAPPRSQALADAPSAGTGDIRDRGAELVSRPVAADGEQGEAPWSALLLAALGLGVLAAGGRLLWLRRASAMPVAELERALRGAGVPLASGTTLRALEARLPEGAGDYLDALRRQRYAAGAAPGARERRGLRRALTRGRGPLAHARIWLALRGPRS